MISAWLSAAMYSGLKLSSLAASLSVPAERREVRWRETFSVSRVFVGVGCEEHLDDLCLVILGSEVRWRENIFVSHISVGISCKGHLDDLCMTILGSEVQRRETSL